MVNAAADTSRKTTFEPLSKVASPDRFSTPVALKDKVVNESSEQPLLSYASPLLALAAQKQDFLPASQDFWTAPSPLRTLSAA